MINNSSSSYTLKFGGYQETVPTLASLRNVSVAGIKPGTAIMVLGNRDPGDQLGGVYCWRPDDIRDDDDRLTIKPVMTSGKGRWRISFGLSTDGPAGKDGTDGQDGADGADGADAALPVFSAGTVTNLASGSSPTIALRGTYPNLFLDIGLVRGVNGTNGTNGTNGSNGTNGTNAVDPAFSIGTVSSLAAGNTPTVGLSGTYPNRVLSFGLPRGADGVTPTISGVSTNTLPAGSQAAVSIASAGGNAYSFTFNLPQGATGPAGSGAGDMLKSENLSGLANYNTALANLGAGTGSGGGRDLFKSADAQAARAFLQVQFYSDQLQAISALSGTTFGRQSLTQADAPSFRSYIGAGTGNGTVTSLAFTNASGVSGTISNATTTPALTLSLGAITPSSVAATGTVTGSNLSGTNTGDQTNITGNAGTATKLATARSFTFGGDVTNSPISFDGSAGVLSTLTLANSGVAAGTYAYPANVTVNAKGLVTSAVAGVEPLARKTPIITYTVNTTASLADAEGLVLINVASGGPPTSYGVPPNSSVAFPIGTRIDVQQIGTGSTSIGNGSGVTINSVGGKRAFSAQFAGVTLIKTATDTWSLIGSLA